MLKRFLLAASLAAALLTPTHAAEAFSQTAIDQLIAASVRLKVADDSGAGTATGTIIAKNGREALVVTCGHVFRESKGQGRILVDVFTPEGPRGLSGELLGYDEKADVAILAVEIPGEFEPAPLAPAGRAPQAGEATVSVGCDHGADPSARVSRINGTNKFAGPPNVQVAGQPVQGRSGGGLFSVEGYLIGVCNAADPQDDEGLYSAAENVRALLARHDVHLHYRSAPPAERASVTPVSLKSPPAAIRRPPLPPRPTR